MANRSSVRAHVQHGPSVIERTGSGPVLLFPTRLLSREFARRDRVAVGGLVCIIYVNVEFVADRCDRATFLLVEGAQNPALSGFTS